jgi:hypothetical protein
VIPPHKIGRSPVCDCPKCQSASMPAIEPDRPDAELHETPPPCEQRPTLFALRFAWILAILMVAALAVAVVLANTGCGWTCVVIGGAEIPCSGAQCGTCNADGCVCAWPVPYPHPTPEAP